MLSKPLTKLERRILRLRFGLVKGKHHTTETVARELGVTRERIRQAEAKAADKIKKP